MSNNLEDTSKEIFRKKLFLSLLVPVIFVSLLWILRFIEFEFGVSLFRFGILPLSAKGLPGILLSPFIHQDASHLFNNSIPILILGSSIFYFYSDVAFRVIAYSWIFTGIMVWLIGRNSWHIGASGLVYSFASFLFLSGLIRRYFRLLALSMLVAYLYGSMVWGMFPFVEVNVSWEAHMMGALSGAVLALWYRKEGPQRPDEPDWLKEDDSESETDEEPKYWITDD